MNGPLRGGRLDPDRSPAEEVVAPDLRVEVRTGKDDRRGFRTAPDVDPVVGDQQTDHPRGDRDGADRHVRRQGAIEQKGLLVDHMRHLPPLSRERAGEDRHHVS